MMGTHSKISVEERTISWSNALRERKCSCSTPKRPRERRWATYLREWNVLLNDSWRSEMVRMSLVHVRDTILYSAKDVWLFYVNCSIQFSACLNRETLILTNDRLVYYLFRASLQILLKCHCLQRKTKRVENIQLDSLNVVCVVF